MKLSVASSVLALVMSYGDIFPFVRGVEVGSNLALRASQSHEMGRALVDKAPFRVSLGNANFICLSPVMFS